MFTLSKISAMVKSRKVMMKLRHQTARVLGNNKGRTTRRKLVCDAAPHTAAASSSSVLSGDIPAEVMR